MPRNKTVQIKIGNASEKAGIFCVKKVAIVGHFQYKITTVSCSKIFNKKCYTEYFSRIIAMTKKNKKERLLG